MGPTTTTRIGETRKGNRSQGPAKISSHSSRIACLCCNPRTGTKRVGERGGRLREDRGHGYSDEPMPNERKNKKKKQRRTLSFTIATAVLLLALAEPVLKNNKNNGPAKKLHVQAKKKSYLVYRRARRGWRIRIAPKNDPNAAAVAASFPCQKIKRHIDNTKTYTKTPTTELSSFFGEGGKLLDGTRISTVHAVDSLCYLPWNGRQGKHKQVSTVF